MDSDYPTDKPPDRAWDLIGSYVYYTENLTNGQYGIIIYLGYSSIIRDDLEAKKLSFLY